MAASERLCGTCGNPFSFEADACPSCGAPGGIRLTFRHDDVPTEEAERRRRELEAQLAGHQREAVARCGFALYGLDAGWTGTRSVGGYGGRGTPTHGRRRFRPEPSVVAPPPEEITNISLTHGDPYDMEAPLVVVETRRVDAGWPGRFTEMQLAQGLVYNVFRETGVHTEAMRATITGRDPTAAWDDIELVVEGRPTAAKLLQAGASWGAVVDVETAILGIHARHVRPADVRLTVIDDPSTYLR